MKAAEFVGMLFLARDVTHSVHLNTRSYAKHVALNVFYDEVIDKADAFAEAYQGRHGLIGHHNPRWRCIADLPLTDSNQIPRPRYTDQRQPQQVPADSIHLHTPPPASHDSSVSSIRVQIEGFHASGKSPPTLIGNWPSSASSITTYRPSALVSASSAKPGS